MNKMLSHDNPGLQDDDIEYIKNKLRELLGNGCCLDFDNTFNEDAQIKRGVLFSKPFEHADSNDWTVNLLLFSLIKDALVEADLEKMKMPISDKGRNRMDKSHTFSKEDLQEILMHCVGTIHYEYLGKIEIFFNYRLLEMSLIARSHSREPHASKYQYSLDFTRVGDSCASDPVVSLPFIDKDKYETISTFDDGKMSVTVQTKNFPMIDYVNKQVLSGLSESCQFFIDCVDQCIKLPIEFAKEFMGLISDPVAYSKDLVETCGDYFPSGQWKKIHGGNRHLFFSTNTSLCEQLTSCSSPQYIGHL
jgi:hypothetical protein